MSPGQTFRPVRARGLDQLQPPSGPATPSGPRFSVQVAKTCICPFGVIKTPTRSPCTKMATDRPGDSRKMWRMRLRIWVKMVDALSSTTKVGNMVNAYEVIPLFPGIRQANSNLGSLRNYFLGATKQTGTGIKSSVATPCQLESLHPIHSTQSVPLTTLFQPSPRAHRRYPHCPAHRLPLRPLSCYAERPMRSSAGYQSISVKSWPSYMMPSKPTSQAWCQADHLRSGQPGHGS